MCLFVRYSAGSIYAGSFQRPSLRPGVLIVSEMQQLQIRAREMAEQVEALAAHTWQPEVDSGNPQKGWGERSNSTKLSSDCHGVGPCMHIMCLCAHIHIIIIKIINTTATDDDGDDDK